MKKFKYLIKHLPNIIRGYYNFIFSNNKEIAKERISICRTNKCGYYDPNGESPAAYVPGMESCGGCGCRLQIKTTDLESSCYLKEIGQTPLWDSILKQAIKDNG